MFASRNRIRNAVLNPRSMAINRDLINQYDISRKRDIRFAFTSFTLILAFFIFLIFSQIIFISFAYGLFESEEEVMFWKTLACFIYTINYSLVFYVNMAANSMFRKEFINIINNS